MVTILHVFGTHAHMKRWFSRLAVSPKSEVLEFRHEVVLGHACKLKCVVIAGEEDFRKIVGMNFHAVVEEDSFRESPPGWEALKHNRLVRA